MRIHTHAAVVLAIKRASEQAGIKLPSDTTISFAETPLLLGRAKDQTTKPATKPQSIEPAKAIERKVAEVGDEARDPEAETPKFGELNEGVEAVPR
jgi:hypothetical protein